jgi:hypothetical protein
MINRLKIKGFKGFDEFELAKLSRVTLLGGRNNVGKTSLLEAMFMFFDRFNPQMFLRQYSQRGVGILPLNSDSAVAPIFFDYDLDREVIITVFMNDIEETMVLKFNPSYIQPVIPAQQTNLLQIVADQRPVQSYGLDVTLHRQGSTKKTYHIWTGSQGIGLDAPKFPMKVRPAIFLASRAPSNASEDAERFGKLDVIGKQNIMLDSLRIIEPNLKSLSSVALQGGSSLIYGDIGLSKKIPIAYMGEGMSRLSSIILGIASADFIFIDECENGFHYSVMTQVWESIGKAAREFNCQVVATTHSYECLRAAYKSFEGQMEEDFTYIRIDRIQRHAIPKIFSFELLGTAMKSDMEVR